MAQRTSGYRRILSSPSIYELFQRLVGARRVRRTIIEGYLRPMIGARLLEIGCGTGDLMEDLPEIQYVGFDLSPDYIDAARRRFGDRGHFFTSRIDDIDPTALGSFDLAVAKGVLHHLDDAEASKVFALAAKVLQPGGRLVTIDPTLVEGQSAIARFIILRDRGQNVRDPGSYASLAQPHLDDVETVVHHDLLRMPYSHAVVVATAPDS